VQTQATTRRRFSTAAFVGAAYAFAATMLGTTLPTPLYALYKDKFGLSELIITVIFATYAVGVIAALLVFGGLSDQIGRRPVLLVGLGFSALSAVAFLVAESLGLLLVGRLLSGFSAGIFTGTATATLVDLAPEGRQGRATLVATLVNMLGLGCGPLLAGIVSQWGPLPLRLTFWIDLGLLIPAFAAILLMPEPVEHRAGARLRIQALRVPAEIRPIFISGALAAFAGFAVLGLCTAVVPAFLGLLGVTNHALVGLVVFAVFAASAAGQLLLEVVPAEAALGAGCGGLIAGMAVLAVGLAASSLGLFIAGALIAGVGQGLSFRSGLAGVNQASPPDLRGEVASSFFVVAYVAISIPVIGEGVLAQASSLKPAGLVFAGVVAALAAIVLMLLARRRAVESQA
jgi:predicted MFS family arabinose efflux permease